MSLIRHAVSRRCDLIASCEGAWNKGYTHARACSTVPAFRSTITVVHFAKKNVTFLDQRCRDRHHAVRSGPHLSPEQNPGFFCAANGTGGHPTPCAFPPGASPCVFIYVMRHVQSALSSSRLRLICRSLGWHSTMAEEVSGGKCDQ